MRAHSIALVLALIPALGACCACDPEGHARDLAGPGAIDCGYAPLGSDTLPAIECAEAAIAEGAPFFVGFARQGRDSEVRTYVTGSADGTFAILGYDGDPGGGSGQCATLVANTCGETPPSRAMDALGSTVLLTCPGTGESAVLCSR